MSSQLDHQLRNIFQQILPNEPVAQWNEDTLILGALPEFDSMSMVTLITLIEEQLNIPIDDNELNAETFESYGSVLSWVESNKN